jgi:hypothetical protein
MTTPNRDSHGGAPWSESMAESNAVAVEHKPLPRLVRQLSRGESWVIISLSITSGNPGKFKHGMYLVYTIYLVYTFIYLFPNKLYAFILLNGYVFYQYIRGIEWVFSMHGDYFLKSYTVLNIAVVYDNHIPWLYNLYLVHSKIIMFFNSLCFFHQEKQWNCHHELEPACTDAFWGGEHHTIPSKAYFTEHFYTTSIYQVYHRICMSYPFSWTLSLQLHASWPVWSH